MLKMKNVFCKFVKNKLQSLFQVVGPVFYLLFKNIGLFHGLNFFWIFDIWLNTFFSWNACKLEDRLALYQACIFPRVN